jgi:hypothetical protein
MAKSEEWIYRLSAGDIAELDDALAQVRHRGSVEIGRRGGMLVSGATLTVALEPV